MKSINKILLSFFVFSFALSFITWHPDLNNHVDWGIRFWQYGPGFFYKANVWSFTWPNQPPGTIYIFAGIRKLFEAVFSFFWFLNVNIPPFPSNIMLFFETNLYQTLLKLPYILADLGIAYLVYLILKELKLGKGAVWGAVFFLINPVVFYNSVIWGQTDSLVNFLALLSFWFLFKKRLTLALIVFAASLYIKLSLVIFLPILLVVAFRQKYSPKKWAIGIALVLVIFTLLTLPFSTNRNPFVWLFYMYKDKVLTQQLQVITANAFNIWAGITGIHERPHTAMLGPLPYKLWGNLLFALSYLPALILVFKKQDIKSVVWCLSIVAFSSFMLQTNMHERYLYPLFPYFTILAVLYPVLSPLYWAVSGISLLNLYNFWWFPRIEVLVKIMSAYDRIMPRILGFVSFFIYLLVYKRFFKTNFKEK